MIDINTKDEDNDDLPLPRSKKTKINPPPQSNDKLISTRTKLKRIKRPNDIDDSPKKADEQIYNKNNEGEEGDEKKPEKKIQVEFMKPNGSSVYQTLLEFHRIYGVLYFIIEELLFVYKCHFFDFPDHSAEGVEITCLIFYLFVHVGRIYFGSLGNRAEASIFVILSIAYSVGSVLTYVYFFCLQTYVLRIELITNGVGMALWLFELLFGLFAFIGISGKESGI